MKQPKVNLISCTANPIELMCLVHRVMQAPIPDSINEMKRNPEKYLGMNVDDYMKAFLLQDGMPTFLEYVNLTFKLENVSQALQQQLIRHRIGFSYSIQSIRCIEVSDFASEENYHNPFNSTDSRHAAFQSYMLDIQQIYRNAIKIDDMPIQDAHGLLPMNIYSTITFSCSLRALVSMLNKRLCRMTQEEFRQVAFLIVNEITEKIDSRILKWIGQPCTFGKCIMEGYNKQKLADDKLEGKQNTDHICPLYMQKFVEGKDENEKEENWNKKETNARIF